jgi:ferredoxin--NADP+ reductase
VSAFRYERTRPDGEGGVVGTGEIREVPIQAFYRAVGYFGSPLDGVPFDEEHGVIPNHEGRVLHAESNEVVPGVYATGWIKRGPVGLIGHTKSDAMETISHLVGDQSDWWSPAHPDEESVQALLAERGVEFTTLDGWHRLDQHELALGAARARRWWTSRSIACRPTSPSRTPPKRGVLHPRHPWVVGVSVDRLAQ